MCLLRRHDRPTASYGRDEADLKSIPQPAASGGFLVLLAAHFFVQLVWAAAEAEATWRWVLQPLGGPRREKVTNQA